MVLVSEMDECETNEGREGGDVRSRSRSVETRPRCFRSPLQDNSNIIATAVLFQVVISTLDADLRHHSSLHLVASVALFRVHWSKGGVMYRAGAFKGV